MQVDFYHLTRDPAEKVVPMLAGKCMDASERLLVVSEDEVERDRLSQALWTASPTNFLAHDHGGSEEETNQPILISSNCDAGNDASFVLIADGKWREEALNFDRAFYLFSGNEIDAARSAWRALSENDNIEPRYWKQDGGRWVEGP